jgi:quinol monooxygenase YgiN
VNPSRTDRNQDYCRTVVFTRTLDVFGIVVVCVTVQKAVSRMRLTYELLGCFFMFARITRFQRKPGTREDATALLNQLHDEIMGLPGMIQFTNVMHADGSGYLLSVMESEALANTHSAKAAAIWAQFAQFMVTIPESEGYDVVVHWTKPTDAA